MGQEDVFGQLLANCAAALYYAASDYILHHGSGQTDRIDPVMVIEAPILGRHDGVGQIFR